MKKLLVIAIGLVMASLTGCASVKDENGNVVGTCYGAPCLLKAAFNANTIDTKTGLMKGDIPLFKIGGKTPASAPAATTTMDKADDVHTAATTIEPAAPAAK